MKRMISSLLLAILLALPLSGCGAVKSVSAVREAITIDVSEQLQQCKFLYEPADGDTDAFTVTSSDPSVVDAQLQSAAQGTVVCPLTPHAAGEATITCAYKDFSAQTTITVTDQAAEEAARKAEEEAARKAEEEAAQKAAEEEAAQKAAEEEAAAQKAAEEEAARKAAEEEAAEKAAAAAVQQESKAASAPQGKTVYITPSGKRWHLSASCGGKNSYAVTMDQVGSRTACKKCAQ